MLIYLLIAAELAIVYTVFWYVYVRDPKPYKIVGNPWGRYGESGFTAGGADPTLPFVVDRHAEMRRWWQSQDTTTDYPDHVAYSDGSPQERNGAARNRRPQKMRLRNHHRPADRPAEKVTEQHRGQFISRVLDMFNKTLGALNVKTP